MKSPKRHIAPVVSVSRKVADLEQRKLYAMISEGEHQEQDFKYEISSVSKIAHSVSAFANTQGGRLLVGVRDNGRIAGVRSEEEMYMIDAASSTHCDPPVACQWQVIPAEGHQVLIATIPHSTRRPVMAREEDGRWVAYVRVHDENIVATPVHLAIWRDDCDQYDAHVTLDEKDRHLLSLLAEYGDVGLTLNRISRLSRMSRTRVIRLLAHYVRYGLVDMQYRSPKFYFVAVE